MTGTGADGGDELGICLTIYLGGGSSPSLDISCTYLAGDPVELTGASAASDMVV